MAKYLLWTVLAIGLCACGGPDLCECQQEAEKDNPDLELLADCTEEMAGLSFEEMEAELARCK